MTNPAPRLKQNPQGKLVSWYRKNPAHSNQVCPYCGSSIGPDSDIPSNKEHLFARGFTPARAATAGDFNFLFRACVTCNSEKAEFERQVATATLLNSPALHTDELALADARRKADSDYHATQRDPATGRKVLMRDAIERFEVQYGPSNGVNLRMAFVAPAAAPPRSIIGLATRHVQGLFGLVATPPDTYADPAQQRFLPPSFVEVLDWFAHTNWAADRLQRWTEHTRAWPLHANVTTAGGFIRAEMRRLAPMQWFWILEWNKALRIAGIITPVGPRVVKEIRTLGAQLRESNARIVPEVPLAPGADVLFTERVTDSFI